MFTWCRFPRDVRSHRYHVCRARAQRTYVTLERYIIRLMRCGHRFVWELCTQQLYHRQNVVTTSDRHTWNGVHYIHTPEWDLINMQNVRKTYMLRASTLPRWDICLLWELNFTLSSLCCRAELPLTTPPANMLVTYCSADYLKVSTQLLLHQMIIVLTIP